MGPIVAHHLKVFTKEILSICFKHVTLMSPTTELIQIYVNINFINFNKFLLCGCVVENGKWLHATGVVLPFQSAGAGSDLMFRTLSS